jgi:GT2 family glycosyltransferase
MTTPKVTFITSIVNLKWIDQLRYYLETDVKTPYEWLVLDNTGQIPVSFSAANNFLAESVETEYLAFLNDDIVLLGDPLPAMLKEFDDPTVGLVGTKILFPNRTIQHGGVGFGVTQGMLLPGHMESGNQDLGQCDKRNYCPVTFALAITPTKLFKELGGLNERYINGFEDLDYCFKIATKGLQIVYAPSTTVLHYQHGSRTSKSDAYNWDIFTGYWGKELAVIEENLKRGMSEMR